MCWQGPFVVLAKVGQCDYRIRVNRKEKVNYANMLKQYAKREVVDTNPPRKDPTVAAVWVVEQDKKSSEFDTGKIPLRRLKQKRVSRLCGLSRSFRLTCTGKPFILETDNKPLQYLQRANLANRRLMHWALLLQPFQFWMWVIPGHANVGANFQSRAV